MTNAPILSERIEQIIRVLRGHRVMLDADLAALYNVATKVLVQAVKRNSERFPADFMFQLTKQELAALEVTVCDFKLGRPTHRPLRVHRAGCRHALFRP